MTDNLPFEYRPILAARQGDSKHVLSHTHSHDNRYLFSSQCASVNNKFMVFVKFTSHINWLQQSLSDDLFAE